MSRGDLLASHIAPRLLSAFVFLQAGPVAVGGEFRFAWLSDTHVGSPTGADDLRASVHDINTRNDIAFVILSGDITELGWNAELATAKAILDSLTMPYHIIPGNHDTKWSESGCTEFRRLWGKDRFAFEYGGYTYVGLHQGPIMRMGDGHFAPEDLRWLDSTLSISPRDQPLIFVTHYPPDPGIDNWYEVTTRLKRQNAVAVLCGHGHANRIMDFEGIPGVMGRSNLRGTAPGGAYSIATIRSDSMFVAQRTPGSVDDSLWCTIALRAEHSGREPSVYPRPDFSVNERYPEVKIKWRVETGWTIASAPALSKDRVVAGSSSGVIRCFSAKDGRSCWQFETGGTVYSTPAIDDRKVVIGSSDGNLYCLDLQGGTLLWKVKTGAPVVASPVIHLGAVYVGGGDGIFRALDLETGSVIWEFRGVGAFVETRPLVTHDRVIFGAWDTYLYALSISDGSLAWKWSNDKPARNLSPAACWPVAANGMVYIVAPDRFMTALDVTTGREIWRSGAHQVREAIGLSEDGTRVYARGMQDTLFAFSTAATRQETVWSTPCGFGYDIDPSMPVESDGLVYFTTKNGLVSAVDRVTGQIRWQHKIGVTIAHTPAAVDGRNVVVTDSDGQIIWLEGK